MFFTSFCPFRLPSKQDSIVNFSLSLILLESQLNILLAECALLLKLLHCCWSAVVIMLSLSVLSAVNCIFCLDRLLFCPTVIFLLFALFILVSVVWLVFVCRVSSRDNKITDCKWCCLFCVFMSFVYSEPISHIISVSNNVPGTQETEISNICSVRSLSVQLPTSVIQQQHWTITIGTRSLRANYTASKNLLGTELSTILQQSNVYIQMSYHLSIYL